MDWTNPLTYGVLLAAATTVGAVAWRIFWRVAKIDPLPEGLRKLASKIRADTSEIRAHIKRIFLLPTVATVHVSSRAPPGQRQPDFRRFATTHRVAGR